jgi:Ca2+/Na+ antiporter
MTEFGVATILGSVCFATCFIPAVAHLANYGLREPKPQSSELEIAQNNKLLSVFMRDMAFIIAGLISLYYFLAVGSITQLNLVLFLLMFVAYAVAFWHVSKKTIDEVGARKKNEDFSAEDL